MKKRHTFPGGRGYNIPATAIAGASDTGTWYSPCPTGEVVAEIQRFQRAVLRPAKIPSRTVIGSTSNIFCGKRWVCVAEKDWEKAAGLAQKWIDANKDTLRYLHSADQEVTA